MNRFLKIKAYTVLLAWLVIFLHNIIPHNHIDSQPAHCHSLFHKNIIIVTHSSHETEYNSAGEDHSTVCHFSPVFFHPTANGSPDFGQLALINASAFKISPLTIISEELLIPISDRYCNPAGYEPHHLRAPPVS